MQNVRLVRVSAREILDSRGNPTVEATVSLSDGTVASAAVPSGASTGSHEMKELRDGDPKRYGGMGVKRAVENICRKISPALVGVDAYDQYAIDDTMIQLDGTEDKSALGANAILAVSLAAARAGAASLSMPLYRYMGGARAVHLPIPMMNILNGGKHAANNIDIQEFMIVPVGAESFSHGVEMCATVYHTLKAQLKKQGLATSVGDEGGFAPDLASDEAAIEALLKAIEGAGYTTDKIGIALDAAASEWVDGDTYRLPKRGTVMTGEALVAYWRRLADTYPILSLEDGAGEDDFTTWEALTKALGEELMLVGDDLFVTSPARFSRGIEGGLGNAILVKPNQIGTVSETMEVTRLAAYHGYGYILSHRSGETEDTSIADLAVATGAMWIKAGAPARGERVAKYNRLLRIERALMDAASYGI